MKTFILRDDFIFGRQPAPARLYLRSYGPDQEWPHSHEFHELVYVRGGSGLHVTEKESYQIYAGDIFWIRPGRMHDFRDMKDLKLANFLFHPEELEHYWLDLRETPGYAVFFDTDGAGGTHSRSSRSCMTFDQAQMIRVEELIVQMDQAWQQKRPGWKFKSTIAFLELVGMICDNCSPAEANASADNILIMRVLNYFERNYHSRVRLERVAAETGRSISSLVHSFKKATGESPIHYLNRFRLEKAAGLLRNTETRISEIALRTGFCDGNYFTKQFSRHFGISPRQYRQATSPVPHETEAESSR
ncbi:helix-turn-helix domain-containing protein [uncultured Victivallis sp.]|uniref:helix-turn-helix domain-containing protein n=1 Tax=uncultured Victivallis sp. TaxID=354118 RepID=UPI00258331BE|nr:helix-turn-helix domain-containing protein [uncultured Victivallis sp.]